MQRLVFILGLVLTFWATVHSAQASNCAMDDYDHNGSLMTVESCEGDVWISYSKPKASLQKIGVTPGTLLFEGTFGADNILRGQARLFSAKCGQIIYDVAGNWEGNYISLAGVAPVRNSSCNIAKYRNDNLLFSLIEYSAPSLSGDWYAIVGAYKSQGAAQKRANQVNGSRNDWFALNTNNCPNFTNGYWIATIGPTSKENAIAWKDWTGLSDAYVKTCN